MGSRVVFVTGAAGEMGSLLIPALSARGHDVVALDTSPLPGDTSALCRESAEVSVLDVEAVKGLVERHRPSWVFHLAALLSTRAERDPLAAHRVNVEATVALMDLCLQASRAAGRKVRFLFPSSIAVYGIPDTGIKDTLEPLKESEWNVPGSAYGCNKLYCELIGAYFDGRTAGDSAGLDFRAIRFPGLISAQTLPSGGTTDYAPEMIHAAARGRGYACFVRPETRLPFMTMPDAVDAFLALAEADRDGMSTRVYNVRAFSKSAAEIRDLVLESFPRAEIAFRPDPDRQAIVDSWPADVDDRIARKDWGFSPRHGFTEAFEDYLLPALRERYGSPRNQTVGR